MSDRACAAILLCAALTICGCRKHDERSTPAKPETKIAWRNVGSWSGRGNVQTESFTSDSGALRIRWETQADAKPGQGVFRLRAHSAISGRPLQDVVDQNGPGDGVAYVQQDPHVFYLVV